MTVLLAACGPGAPAEGGGSPAPAAAAAPAAATVAVQDAASGVELSEPIVVRGLSIALPAAWNRLEPRSAMRLLEAEIPGADGPGEISAYFFGPGSGGGAAANIDRWKGQVVPDPGAPEPAAQSLEREGVRLTWIELEGTVKASTIGSFPTTDLPDAALFGAVIEAPGGPWYLRAVGPGATMREQRQAFLAMLDTARPAG